MCVYVTAAKCSSCVISWHWSASSPQSPLTRTVIMKTAREGSNTLIVPEHITWNSSAYFKNQDRVCTALLSHILNNMKLNGCTFIVYFNLEKSDRGTNKQCLQTPWSWYYTGEKSIINIVSLACHSIKPHFTFSVRWHGATCKGRRPGESSRGQFVGQRDMVRESQW